MPFRAPHSNKRLLYSRNDLAGPRQSPCATLAVTTLAAQKNRREIRKPLLD